MKAFVGAFVEASIQVASGQDYKTSRKASIISMKASMEALVVFRP